MKLRANIFSYFVIGLYLTAAFYILISGVGELGTGQEYPYLPQGVFLLLLLGSWFALNMLSGLAARLRLFERLSKKKRLFLMLEVVYGAAVLAGAAALRLYYLKNMPMSPESDYKTYYEVADLLNRGTLLTEGTGYCDYIAMFPHVFGYPYVLSKVFGIFGTSVAAAQYFNVFLSLLSVVIVERIGRLLAGRPGGLLAFTLAAFWPSQILYINMVASEYLFSCLMLLDLWIFVRILKGPKNKKLVPEYEVFLHALFGFLGAVTAVIRPMALILIIAGLLCILPVKKKLPIQNITEIPVSLKLLSRGWRRCLLILVSYMAASWFFSMGVSYAVDREIASGSASYGYNLLVGLNQESAGGWNEEDSKYLYDALDRTGSATEAHLACRDLALQRLFGDVRGVFNLFIHKFQVLWSNDDYGSTWNLLFMDQQGNLTKGREELLYTFRSVGNDVYLLVVALAALEGIFLWKKGNGRTYLLMLLFIGTAGMHLFVENQNRYHFHILYVWILLAACAVRRIYDMNQQKVWIREAGKIRRRKEEEKDRKKREDLEKEERRLQELRQEAMESRFCMEEALKKGYVQVSVSEVYKKEEQKDCTEKDKTSED